MQKQETSTTISLDTTPHPQQYLDEHKMVHLNEIPNPSMSTPRQHHREEKLCRGIFGGIKAAWWHYNQRG
jgi:hypothetical protein